jgi:hypothetical protein
MTGTKWIDIRDRLPELAERAAQAKLVVYCGKTGIRRVTVAVYTSKGWKFLLDRNQSNLSARVTRWQDMPEMPEAA